MSRHLALCSVLLIASACVEMDVDVDPMAGSDSPEPGLYLFDVDCPLRYDAYAIERYWLPSSSRAALDMGLNLDEDVQMRPDNALGLTLAAGAGFSQFWLAKRVEDSVSWTFELARCADDSDDAIAVWLIGPDGDRGFAAIGQIDEDGIYAARRGIAAVPASAFVDGGAGSPIEWAEGRGVSLLATASDTGEITGTLAFAIEEDGYDAIAYGVYDAAQVGLASDPACLAASPECFWTAQFDDDRDGQVSLEEVATSAALTSLLAPDVDLLDADGAYWPRHDEVKESLSFGFQFRAIPADS